MRGSTQDLRGAYEITPLSGKLSPWQHIPTAASVCSSPVGPENILTRRRSEGLRCETILEGAAGADQSGAGELRLPSASAGAAAPAARETASALVFKASTGFCFRKQTTLS